jgi:hygromycin-B 7''-O-kinase
MYRPDSLLPPVITDADYALLRTRGDVWFQVMHIICQRHGLAHEDLRRFGDGTDPADGSCVAFAAGKHHVIKLFPPYQKRLYEAELVVAGHVFGKLSIATPEIYAHGTVDEWPYLVMSRLQGSYLSGIWDRLDQVDQVHLVIELAGVLVQLHGLPTNDLPYLDTNWKEFVEARVEGCVQRHREHGVPEYWLQQMPDFLAHASPLYPFDFPSAIISGDIHQYHLLARLEHGQWRLSGLFDFDDALLGFCEYDLAAAGLFLMAGRSTLLRPFLLTYGYAVSDLNERLSHRLLAYTLLHRYRPFNWVREEFVKHSCSTLEELAEVIYLVKINLDNNHNYA